MPKRCRGDTAQRQHGHAHGATTRMPIAISLRAARNLASTASQTPGRRLRNRVFRSARRTSSIEWQETPIRNPAGADAAQLPRREGIRRQVDTLRACGHGDVGRDR